MTKSFAELNLRPEVLAALDAAGFDKPFPIQEMVIPIAITGVDLIGQAKTGTGKTLGFGLPIVNNVKPTGKIQALVVVPTRELGVQVAAELEKIGTDLSVAAIYGGRAFEPQLAQLKEGVDILVATPGRLLDLHRQKEVDLTTVKQLVLDEADEMLSAGFKDQMYNIFQNFGPDIQVALFSATLPESLEGIIEKIMRDPVRISVKREMLTLEGIKQYVVAVDDDRQKYATLKDLYKYITASQTIIYCNSIKRVQDLYEAMREDEFPVCRIHGNMDKKEREATFNEFRNGASRVLISSNVTARGIDIQQVNIVINFDVPKDVHTYLHRIGRSGRWGRKGTGINFVTRRDTYQLKAIETFYHCHINEFPSDYKF